MTVGFLVRVSLLFCLGVSVSLFINVIQAQRSHTLITSECLGLIKSGMWVPPACGISAVLIGLLYPTLDRLLGNPMSAQRNDWTSVTRCVALFVGLNHATAKIDFMSHEQLSLCLATMSFGLWYYFDGSRPGLGLGLVIALLASAVNQLMISLDAYRPSVDFLHVRAWLPCIFFSGSVTVGLIGRQLAKCDQQQCAVNWPAEKARLKVHGE